MIQIPQNKPEASAIKILRICHQYPGIGLQELIEKSGQSSANVGRVVQNLRSSGNLCPTKSHDGKAKRGFYELTTKGLGTIGVYKPPERAAYQSSYTELTAITMDSHRSGARAAQSIAAIGLRC